MRRNVPEAVSYLAATSHEKTDERAEAKQVTWGRALELGYVERKCKKTISFVKTIPQWTGVMSK